MKKKIFILVIFVFFIGFFLKNIPNIFGYILVESHDYIALTEDKKRINSRFFLKKKKSNNENTLELIVCFNENLDYKYITIVPKEKLIGLSNQTHRNIVLFSNLHFAYLRPNGGRFTVLNDNINGVIYNFKFSKNMIKFNTFGELKKFGSSITIEKI